MQMHMRAFKPLLALAIAVGVSAVGLQPVFSPGANTGADEGMPSAQSPSLDRAALPGDAGASAQGSVSGEADAGVMNRAWQMHTDAAVSTDAPAKAGLSNTPANHRGELSANIKVGGTLGDNAVVLTDRLEGTFSPTKNGSLNASGDMQCRRVCRCTC